MSRLMPWRQWRFELTQLFRDAGYSDQVIRKMDWGALRRDWATGERALDVFNDQHRADDRDD